ncbi:uncharacterized protein B0P05DRAFT_534971 [Gilbertella persicaria]|uniref:Uncharacterized protein n=1 Tax=Rhizopus stolonifer TaxID=4846 RepID=A0A367IY26_RHIST|nr:uncharacterized protein B0P05DRAFT_534971 [Gilbertella persicaria]KAI8084288.1 hypothetical protein B0P05DRAFT_534971 [Gilbertella persicaria]RCH82556.1 hypothetical protein CU098_006291 [Rhizopus stolonifer]
MAPNSNQILFIVIVAIIFTLALIGIYILMSKANDRRRELLDLEQRLQAQEEFLVKQRQQQQLLGVYQPAMVKDGYQIQQSPSYVIMTPHKDKKKSKRESFLQRVYGFRNASSPFVPDSKQQIMRPSSIRPPSFLPMREKERFNNQENAPPAYDEYKATMAIKSDPIQEK